MKTFHLKRILTVFKSFFIAHQKLTVFVLIFLLSFSFIWISNFVFNDNVYELNFDASQYWRLATETFDLGSGSLTNFSLNNYPNTIRGYFLPFLFYIASLIGRLLANDGIYGFFLINSAVMAFLISILLPSLLSVENAPRRTFSKSLLAAVALSLLLFFFWRWIFYETLSDIYGFFFAILSLWLLRKASDILWVENTQWTKGLLLMLAAGLSSYAAYNVRIIYVFSTIAMFAFIAFGLFRCEKPLVKRAAITFVGLAIFSLGNILVGIPEAIINYNHHNISSIMVVTALNPGASLFSQQLLHGIFTERKETYIGDVYPVPWVHFISPAGSLVLSYENITYYDFSMGSYIRLMMSRPFDMLAIYWRNFINGLTPLFPVLYVRDLNSPVLHMISTSVLLWLVGGLSLFQRLSRRTHFSLSKVLYKSNIPYWLCILIPCLLIIPSQMEVRYMLPFHIFLYSALCYKTDFKALWSYFKKSPLLIVFIFLLIYAFWLSTISSTLSYADYGGFLIH